MAAEVVAAAVKDKEVAAAAGTEDGPAKAAVNSLVVAPNPGHHGISGPLSRLAAPAGSVCL